MTLVTLAHFCFTVPLPWWLCCLCCVSSRTTSLHTLVSTSRHQGPHFCRYSMSDSLLVNFSFQWHPSLGRQPSQGQNCQTLYQPLLVQALNGCKANSPRWAGMLCTCDSQGGPTFCSGRCPCILLASGIPSLTPVMAAPAAGMAVPRQASAPPLHFSNIIINATPDTRRSCTNSRHCS